MGPEDSRKETCSKGGHREGCGCGNHITTWGVDANMFPKAAGAQRYCWLCPGAARKPSQRRQHFRSTLIPGGRGHPTEGNNMQKAQRCCWACWGPCRWSGISSFRGEGGVGGDEAAEMGRTLHVWPKDVTFVVQAVRQQPWRAASAVARFTFYFFKFLLIEKI